MREKKNNLMRELVNVCWDYFQVSAKNIIKDKGKWRENFTDEFNKY